MKGRAEPLQVYELLAGAGRDPGGGHGPCPRCARRTGAGGRGARAPIPRAGGRARPGSALGRRGPRPRGGRRPRDPPGQGRRRVKRPDDADSTAAAGAAWSPEREPRSRAPATSQARRSPEPAKLPEPVWFRRRARPSGSSACSRTSADQGEGPDGAPFQVPPRAAEPQTSPWVSLASSGPAPAEGPRAERHAPHGGPAVAYESQSRSHRAQRLSPSG